MPVSGLLLERLSPRQVYAIGSLTTALGLVYVALAIGKVRLLTHKSLRAGRTSSADCATQRGERGERGDARLLPKIL